MKYEHVYVHAYESVSEAKQKLATLTRTGIRVILPPPPTARWRTTAGQCQSSAARSRRTSAKAAPRSRWIACCAKSSYSESPCGTVWRLRPQVDFDVAQRLACGQLREGHRKELGHAREFPHFVIAVMRSHAAASQSRCGSAAVAAAVFVQSQLTTLPTGAKAAKCYIPQ